MSSKQRILVVDDEQDIVELVSYNLTKEGYQVYTAPNGKLGIEVAKQVNPDLIILDVMMPEMDGIEACRMALLKLNKGILDGNFIEGMACVGGCIGGAGCLTHGEKSKSDVDKYGREAFEKTISDAVSILK